MSQFPIKSISGECQSSLLISQNCFLVMAWRRQATIYYLSQWCSMSPWVVTNAQWVNLCKSQQTQAFVMHITITHPPEFNIDMRVTIKSDTAWEVIKIYALIHEGNMPVFNIKIHVLYIITGQTTSPAHSLWNIQKYIPKFHYFVCRVCLNLSSD